MRSRCDRTLCAFMLASLVLISTGAAATDEENRWFFRLDAFETMSHSTTVRYESALLGLGTEFTLENELGIDDAPSQARFSIGRRIGAERRHEIEFSYVDISRDGTATLRADLVLGDFTFPIGVQTAGVADTTDIELNYKYYFLFSERGELGVIAGIHFLEFDSLVTATIAPSGPFPIVIPIRVSVDTDAPIPVVGFRGDFEFARKWHVNASLKVVDGHVGDIEGTFVEFQAAVEHYTFLHLGFGLGFFADDLDAEETSGDAVILGTYEQERQGAFLFLKARF